MCLVEKSSQIGAHILSGNVFEPRALNELFPKWKEMENPPPLNTKVTSDCMKILTKNSCFSVPNFLMPKLIDNHGNYIISLGHFCEWLNS